MLGSRTGRLDSIPLIRASTEDRDVPRRPTPSSTRVLRLRACATAAGMLQHSSVFHGTSCVPTCPGRIRTGDAHLRRVALFPLSYGGVCLLPATTPASVLRVGGVHIGPPVLAALAGWRLFHPSDGVLRAFHADAFDYPSNMTGHRIPLPISRSSVNCGRAPRGIRTHNPRLKRTLL